MSYMSQEKKKELAPRIKGVLKKYGVKGSIAVRHHSTLVVNLKSGVINFKAQSEHYQVNPYHVESQWTGVAMEFLLELLYGTPYLFYEQQGQLEEHFQAQH